MKRLLVWLAMLLPTLALTQGTMAAESWRCGRPAESASSLIPKWLQSKPGGLERHGESRRLAVLLHAYTGDSGNLADTCEVLLGAYGSDTDVLMPDLPFGVFSMTDPYVVVADLIKQVDDAWETKEKAGSPYEDVVLVGHSIGSLFVRKLYVAASGETADAPFEPALVNRLAELQASDLKKPRKWAAATQRVILLAGLNSGWTISHHMTPLRGIVYSAGLWLGRVVHAVSGGNLIIMSAHRGAPFITQLRLQWLAMRAKQKATGGTPSGAKVVQLLGTIDDLVPPEDNVDPVTGSDFVYLDVPFTNHANITKMDSHEEHGVTRAEAFKRALVDNSLAPGIGAPVAVTESDVRRPEPDVTEVVFVVHGIRDEGYWTEKIARRVLQLSESLKNATPPRKIAIVTAGYGYFPMLSFLRPGARQEKVEWLMDQYTQAKARYPNAAFSFVGHSNGTYLLAKALHDYPAVKFKNVLFAGSVVRTDYDWGSLKQRVGAVFNVRASEDWVVGWFPHALETVNLQDVGGAGFLGFTKPGVTQMPGYVIGGHSSALGEVWWDSIAEFVLHGRFNPPQNAPVVDKAAGWVSIPAVVPLLIWAVIAAVLGLILIWLLRLPIREWKRTLAVVGYVWLVWFVLTEV
jgi:pimeloyl-ACP methyl ester carboxylesterase